MSDEITINWDQDVSFFDNVPKMAKEAIIDILIQTAQNTYDESQMDVPVDTGRLKESGRIDYEANDDEASAEVTYGDGVGYPYYGIEDGYAWFQELGTRFLPPQSYLGPAFLSNGEKAMQKFIELTN